MIHAFSDDSITEHLVVAGFVVLDEGRVADAEEILARAKAKVGVAVNEPFHCRVIFSGDARKRSAWAHVETVPLYDLVRSVALELKGIAECPLVCLANPKAVPAAPATPGGPVRRPDVKEVASIVHGAALSGLTGRFGHDGFKVWTTSRKSRGVRAVAEPTRPVARSSTSGQGSSRLSWCRSSRAVRSRPSSRLRTSTPTRPLVRTPRPPAG
jgi:hypothetical protein